MRSMLGRRLGRVSYREAKSPPRIVRALRAYFQGDLGALDQIPIAPVGTPFQKRVWQELRRIRPGRTATYADLARRIGTPSAARAVGGASGANPIWIVIPCHRLVATGGGLGGYGGGLGRKRGLLAHEGAGGASRRSATSARASLAAQRSADSALA
jgi:methylated-DNA-[protein]-cysteine S-methyltransferase